MSYSGSFGNVARDDASVHTANQGYIQGVPPPVAEVPQARARFSLTPALAGHEILDYTTAAGAKTFEAAIKPLSETRYECTSKGLRNFLEDIAERAANFGWNITVLDIPNDANDVLGTTKNLLKHYGEISLDHIRKHAKTYVNTQTRAAQDSIQLYSCLWASLSDEGKSKVNVHRSDYHIGEQRVGALLLKVIIRESHIDTNATISHIRTQLSSLDTYLPTIGHDIGKLNDYVTSLHDALLAGGEVSNDLLINLFKGYKASSDRRFVAYIEKKEEDYEDGSTAISPHQLMTLAKNRYEVLVEKGLWNAPSAEEEKIMALEATIKKLQGARGANRNTKKQSPQNTNKKNEKKRSSNKSDDLPSWVFEKLKPGESKTKTVNGKKWYFCDHHGRWTRHTTEKCKKTGINEEKTKTNQENIKYSTRSSKLAKAMNAIAEEDDE